MTQLATIDLTKLPERRTSDSDLKRVAKRSAGFLKNLRLVSKGELVDSRKCGPGSWIVYENKDKVIDLGDKCDVLILDRRAKALETTNREAIRVSYDPNSELFADIESGDGDPARECMFGTSFLVVERTTGELVELFFCTTTQRPEAANLFPFLPLTQAEIDKMKARGENVDSLKPHDARVATLGSKHITKKFSYFVPTITACSTPLTKLPSAAEIQQAMIDFRTAKDSDHEIVEEPANKRAR